MAPLCLSIVLGCDDPSGPFLSGQIRGRVSLYDDGISELPSHEGVEVTIQGSNISTISDSAGKWQLERVSTGIHTLIFRKTGFFDGVLRELQFVGGGTITLYSHSLYALPTFRISQISATTDTIYDFIEVVGTVSKPSTGSYRVLICYDTTRDVSPSKYVFFETTSVYSPRNSFTHTENMDSHRLKSGNTIYMRAYPASALYPIEYDSYTGEERPANFLPIPSPIDSAILP